MTLETILDQTIKLAEQTIRLSGIDVAGHCLTGAFLVERYFPEIKSKSKKAFLAFISTLYPDLDFLTFGLIPHRTLTHNLYWGAMITTSIYAVNREDHDRVGEVNRFFTSRYVKLASLGVISHLVVDHCNDNLQRLAYCAVAATALTLQVVHNKRNNRYTPRPKKQKVKPCIVNNDSGKYLVQEGCHCKLDDTSYTLWKDRAPEYSIPNYQYGAPEGLEEVRAFQAANTVPRQDVFDKLDALATRVINQIKNSVGNRRPT